MKKTKWICSILTAIILTMVLTSCGGGGGGGGGGTAVSTSGSSSAITGGGGTAISTSGSSSTFNGIYTIAGSSYNSLVINGDENSGTATFSGSSGTISGTYARQAVNASVANGLYADIVTFSGTYVITISGGGTIIIIFSGSAVTISAGTTEANGSGTIVVVTTGSALTGTWVANYEVPCAEGGYLQDVGVQYILNERDEYVFRADGTFTITMVQEGDRIHQNPSFYQSPTDHFKYEKVWSGTYTKRDDFYYINIASWTEKDWVDYVLETDRSVNPNIEIPFYALINNNRLYYLDASHPAVYHRESGSSDIVGRWNIVNESNGQYFTGVTEYCSDGTLCGGASSGVTSPVGTYSFSGNSLTESYTSNNQVAVWSPVMLTDNWLVLNADAVAIKQ